MNNKTINYYNKHTKSFIQTTRSVDFTNIQNKFLSYLPPEASILDFGCGSGRDTKYFLKQNYKVTAIDGSEAIWEMIKVPETLRNHGVEYDERIYEKAMENQKEAVSRERVSFSLADAEPEHFTLPEEIDRIYFLILFRWKY